MKQKKGLFFKYFPFVCIAWYLFQLIVSLIKLGHYFGSIYSDQFFILWRVESILEVIILIFITVVWFFLSLHHWSGRYREFLSLLYIGSFLYVICLLLNSFSRNAFAILICIITTFVERTLLRDAKKDLKTTSDRKCPYCSAYISDTDRFCGSCGAKLPTK